MKLEQNILDTLFLELVGLVGERFSTNLSSREVHSKDESYHLPQLPDAVVMVHSTQEVSAIVKLCSKYQCPIIPFGAGTSLEGQVIPKSGGGVFRFYRNESRLTFE